MKSRKRLFINLALIIAAVLMAVCLFGCNKNDAVGGFESSAPERAPRGDATDQKTTPARALGFYPISVESDDSYIAEGAVSEDGENLVISAYSDGMATLTVYDWWGNYSTVKVTVSGSEIADREISDFSDKSSLNAKLLGAGKDNKSTDRPIIQNAIDKLSAAGGGTLYFPAGRYDCGNEVGSLILREGVTLKLQGKADNVKDGYTDELAQRVKNGEFAVLTAWITNYDGTVFGGGNDAASNIAIIGGMMDMEGNLATKEQIDLQHIGPAEHPNLQNIEALSIWNAEKVLIQDVIFKDAYNGHAMELSGLRGATVKDCMFAGFVIRPNTKGKPTDLETIKEAIQIEQLFGWADGPVRQGEFFYGENITVDGCYFGDSDEAGYQLIGVGHHSDVGKAICDGVNITGNVFDNPYHSAINFAGYINVKISGNKFISERSGMFSTTASNNTGKPSLINLWVRSWTQTYEAIDGTVVTQAESHEGDGIRFVDITGNEFVISGSSKHKVITAISAKYSKGANTVTLDARHVEGIPNGNGVIHHGEYSGYIDNMNMISDLNFSENKISVTSTAVSSSSVADFKNVANLTVLDNEIVSATSFTESYGGCNGISVVGERDHVSSNKFIITTALSGCKIIIDTGTDRLSYSTDSSMLTLLPSEHIRFELSIDSAKQLTVTVRCDEGYKFAGFTGAPSGETLLGEVTMTAKETKK